jgi:sterol desaturase/sphingolipid hydroxylase (fatty acid hydroxylase superfamily)
MWDLDSGWLASGRGLLAVVGLAGAMIWERKRPFRGPSLPPLRHDLSNLTLWMGNTALLQLALGAAGVAAAIWAQQRGVGVLHGLDVPFVAHVALSFLALDLLTYALHRLYHAVPVLWRIHRVHHSDPDLRTTTGVRFHVLEVGLSTLVRAGCVVASGADPFGVALFEGVLLLASQLQHADVRLTGRVDVPLRRLVVTPNLHRIHHSDRREEADSNFGTILTAWDRALGTFRTHPSPEEIRIGLPEGPEPRPTSLLALWTMPFRPARRGRLGAALSEN